MLSTRARSRKFRVKTNGAVIDVVQPLSVRARMRGLLGSSEMSPSQGVLLKAKQVHTFGMLFTIEAVHLNRRFQVLRVTRMPPGKVGAFVLRAKWVLELGDAEPSRLGITKGSFIEEID
jgi:uncharacterized membrane protein (UPF0127 family)